MSIFTALVGRKHSALPLLSLRSLREMPGAELQCAVRGLCATVPMTDDMALCRTLGRYKMFVDRADLGFSSHIMLDGFWQMWVTRAILGSVREGMSVADMGANVGYYTLLLADLVGGGGRVHAVEPEPRAMQLLQRSVAVNGFAGRVSLHGRLSAAPVEVPAAEPAGAAVGRRALSAKMVAARSPAAAARVAEPQSVCLDDVVKDERLDFVKIDGKGAERDVWNGMTRILARRQPLTIVLDFAADRQPAPDVFLADIAAAGFRLARVDASGNVVAASAEEILASSQGGAQTLSLSR